MRLIFFGTSRFAVSSLKRIMGSSDELLAVVTQPDRKKGRHLKITPSPVKLALKGSNIPIHQFEDISNSETIKILKKYNADLFIVVAFGQILKKVVLDIPKKYCVNLHASLLPKYRGAAPINWVIMNGETSTGVTTIKMNERMDEGEIILQEELEVSGDDTSETLAQKLSLSGSELLIKTIDSIRKNKASLKEQDHKLATYAAKLKKSDGLIDWSISAKDIHNRVRGLLPWPGAYTEWKGKSVKILESDYSEERVEKGKPGDIIDKSDDGIVMATGNGKLIIKSLQLQGGKPLTSAAFLRGHKL